MPLETRCPICKRTVNDQMPEFPFCTERCRILDLGAWASEEYRISSPAIGEELPERRPLGSDAEDDV